MVIQKNIPGMNSNRLYTQNSSELSKSLEKLSSGYQVNRAGDNAAGLAVSEKMRSQLAGIKQDIRNVQDGISYIQTGEGALDEIHAILQRCKTISTESANGTYDQVDRDALQLEFDQLCSEVDHISETDFNGRFIFKDNSVSTPYDPVDRTSSSSSMIMFRHLDGDYIPVFVTTESLAANINKVVGTPGKGFTNQALTDFANDIKNTYLPQVLSRIVSTLPGSSKPTVSGMQIGFNFYNDSSDNILASVSSNGTSFQLNINVHYLNMNNGSIDMTDSLASTMTHEMVHAIMFDTVSNGMLGIDPSNNQQNLNGPHLFPKWFTEGMAEAVAGGSRRLSAILPIYNNSSFTAAQVSSAMTSMLNTCTWDSANNRWERSDSDIRTWAAKISNTSDQLVPYTQGYAVVMYLGHLVGNNKNAAAPINGDKIASGLDTVLTEIASGKSLDRVVREYTGFSGTDDFINNFGSCGSDVLNFLRGLMDASNAKYSITSSGNNISANIDSNGGAGALGTPQKLAGSAGTLLSGGSNSYFILDLENENVDNSNKMGSQQNKYEGGSAIRDGKDRDGNTPGSAPPTTPTDPPGGNTDPPGGTGEPGGNTGNPGGGTGTGDNDGTAAAAAYKGYDSLILQVGPRSSGLVRFTMKYHTNAIGDLKCDFDCSASGLKIDSLSISTQKRANEAIDRLDHAINKVSMMRASFGAAQNRLEHKINNLNVSEENITASESQIRDTDMAEEMMKFTKLQIVSQASQSMLSQAMSLPQQVISLLA